MDQTAFELDEVRALIRTDTLLVITTLQSSTTLTCCGLVLLSDYSSIFESRRQNHLLDYVVIGRAYMSQTR